MSSTKDTTTKVNKKSAKGLLVVLIIVIAVVFIARLLYSGVPARSSSIVRGPSQSTSATNSITITKGEWSRKIDTSGRRFRVISVDPPARRMTRVNGNPERIHPLPAGPASDIFVGDDVYSHEFMIEPDETVSSSVIKYVLY